MNKINILLNQDDFSCLVRGGILNVIFIDIDGCKISEVQIALKDIGFDNMNAEITRAELSNDIYKDHTKIISLT